jgi:hypothetical protein
MFALLAVTSCERFTAERRQTAVYCILLRAPPSHADLAAFQTDPLRYLRREGYECLGSPAAMQRQCRACWHYAHFTMTASLRGDRNPWRPEIDE